MNVTNTAQLPCDMTWVKRCCGPMQTAAQGKCLDKQPLCQGSQPSCSSMLLPSSNCDLGAAKPQTAPAATCLMGRARQAELHTPCIPRPSAPALCAPSPLQSSSPAPPALSGLCNLSTVQKQAEECPSHVCRQCSTFLTGDCGCLYHRQPRTGSMPVHLAHAGTCLDMEGLCDEVKQPVCLWVSKSKASERASSQQCRAPPQCRGPQVSARGPLGSC